MIVRKLFNGVFSFEVEPSDIQTNMVGLTLEAKVATIVLESASQADAPSVRQDEAPAT